MQSASGDVGDASDGRSLSGPAATATPPALAVPKTDPPTLAARRSVLMRAQQSIHTGPTVLVAGVICGIAFSIAGAGVFAVVWAALVVAGALVNRTACLRIIAAGETTTAADTRRRQVQLWWLTVMNTSIVGSGIWIVSIGAPPTSVLISITMIQSLYQLGALINASTHPPTFITGTWINFGLLVLFWLTSGLEGVPIAAAVGGLALLATRFSWQLYGDFENTVRIQFENTELLAQVQAQVAQANQARAAAELANSAKSRFLASASHDLRQPLHALLIFASLLEQAPPEERTALLQQLRAAAGSLERLLNGLMDLSRLDAQAFRITIAAVPLDELIGPIVEQMRPRADEKGIELSVTLPAHAAVLTDRLLFERVLRNLLDNAIKYTARGSVRVQGHAHGETVSLSVEDTGPGIAPADHARVFQEFERLRDAGSDAEDGFGLGLAIVARACALLGHEITLESAVGAGCRFTLTLRQARGLPAAAPAPDPLRDLPGADARNAVVPPGTAVLVIDDHTGVRQAMQAIVRSIGGTCHSVASRDALEAFLASDPPPVVHALIADSRLGGEPIGLKLVSRVRERYPGLPASLVTADRDAIDDAAQSGGIRVFPKPVADDVLIDWLMALTEASAPDSPAAENRPAA